MRLPGAEHLLDEQDPETEWADSIFADMDWKDLWASAAADAADTGYETGILLINTSQCSNTGRLEEALTSFIAYKWQQGVQYSTGTIEWE